MTSLDPASREQLAGLVAAVETSTGRARCRARRQLRVALDRYPDRVRASADLLLVQATLHYQGEGRRQRWRRFEWCAYAYQNTRDLPVSNRIRAAAEVCWAAELDKHGNPAAAENVMRQALRDDLRDTGPYAMYLTALIAQVRHDLGECASAISKLDELWIRWRHLYPTDQWLGRELLYGYHTMLTSCGYTDLAANLLDSAATALPTGELPPLPTATTLHKHRAVCTIPAPAHPGVPR
jgi:hypothetical protein